MWSVLKARIQQKKRTIAFPAKEPVLPDRFRGLPLVNRARCPQDCPALCMAACPTHAISYEAHEPVVDLGKCLFCTDCQRACPHDALSYSKNYSLAARSRSSLLVRNNQFLRGVFPDEIIAKIFGRSLKLRQVSAGGCNGCELDLNVLSTVVFDLGRFGVEFVASPRHADGLVVTGPVTANMHLALMKTYAAIAEPKIVIAVGACAISGGPYIEHAEVKNGVEASKIPVDLFIPGCPPHPATILDGILRLLGHKTVLKFQDH